MTITRFDELTRTELAVVLPKALVILPVGAVEQHGPHLATGTDSLLITAVVNGAADIATERASRPLVIAPTLVYGASDHHLPFGGTLSISQRALHSVLLDLCRSLYLSGGRRVLLLTGHGGNRSTCSAVAEEASRSLGMSVAASSYWELGGVATSFERAVPGHAGAYETGLVLGLRPDLVRDRPPRTPPKITQIAGVDLHEARLWESIEGFTDDPAAADADAGRREFDAVVARLAAAFVELAAAL